MIFLSADIFSKSVCSLSLLFLNDLSGLSVEC